MVYVIPTLGKKHMLTPTEKLAYIITSYFSFTEHTTNMYVGYSRSLKQRVLDMVGTGSINADQLASQVVSDISMLIATSFDTSEYTDLSEATVALNNSGGYDITIKARVRHIQSAVDYYIPGTSTINNNAIVVAE